MKRLISIILAASMLLCLCGCGSEEPAQTQAPTEQQAVTEPANMEKIYETMSAQMPEMILMDETTMLNFCGIQAEDCVQVVAAICADGLITDEVWLIEAKDQDALDRLKALAETRLQMKGEESITYSPEQYAVVQEAKILTDGLYMALIVSPDVEALETIFLTAVE
jgi:hypothetical protein